MKKIKKFSSKFLAVLMSFLIIISIIPMQALATDYQNHVTLTTVEESAEELIIKEEIVKERTLNSKTYLLTDGTYCDISTTLPMHQYVDNAWQDLFETEENPTTVNETITCITELQNSTSNNSISTYTSVGDGYVFPASTEKVKIYGITSTAVTSGNATISSSSMAIIKCDVFKEERVYNKTEVTVNAKIKIACNNLQNENTITAKPINTDWTEDSLNATTIAKDSRSSIVVDYNSIDSSSNYTWDITSEYIKWENGSKNNNGILLKGLNSGSTLTISNGVLMRHYRVIDDNDIGFTYHTIDMGRAGVVYVNDYTNTVLVEREELGFSGNIMPVFLSRFITPHPSSNSWFAGGRWNYESTLEQSGDTYIWNMMNGSSARFQRAIPSELDTNGREKWIESTYNAQGYALWIDSAQTMETGHQNNIIIDEENNVYKFSDEGHLISIISGIENTDTIDIKYDGSKISYIIDGVGRIYLFNYDNPDTTDIKEDDYVYQVALVTGNLDDLGELTKDNEGNYVVNSTGIYIDYMYETINEYGPYLTEVKYSDDKSVFYSYDDYGRLTSVKNIDGSILEFSYANSCEKISSYSEYCENPAYLGRISSYCKKVLNNNNSYIVDYTVEIDAQNVYRRVFTQKTYPENSNTQSNNYLETIQFNRNLDVLYMVDNKGNEYYADYDDSHNLVSLVIPDKDNSNLIYNGTLEPSLFTDAPEGWEISSGIALGNAEFTDNNGENYILFKNTSNQTYYASQTVTINGLKDNKYVVSASGTGNGTIPKDDRFWGVRIFAVESNGTKTLIHSMAFDPSLYETEQTRTTAFSLTKDTEKIVIQLISSEQLGSVIFDDISLYKSDLAYVAAVDDAESIKTCTCSNCENINCTCECEIESNCNCVSCKIKTTNEKVDNKEIITTTNGSKSLISKYEYTSDLNYPSHYIDENNVSTSYEYSLTNGLLLSEKFVSDSTISYGYDAIGMLTSVSQTVTNVINNSQVNMNTTYSYENDKISSITHNGFSYNYEYDIYGNVKSISVGGNSLVTYSYNDDYNRSIGSIMYGNGKKLSYKYDAKGNITKIYIDNETSPKYEYEYDIYNNLISYTDYANNTITSYNKTIDEKTYEIVVQRIDDAGTIIYSIEDGLDSSYVETVFGRDYSISKTISNDSITGTSTATTTTPVILFNEEGKATVTTTSDSLDRRIEEKLKFTTDDVAYQNASIEVKNEYTYKDVNSSQTTKLIERFKATLITTDENGFSTTEELINLKYKYDSAGRIITIYEHRGSVANGYDHPIALYEYDTSGQLIAEAHGYSNDVWSYTYDAGGNITSKNKLDYNDVIFEDVDNPHFINLDTAEPLDTISYGYDSTYKDLLISFNDKPITYDDAYNPLNYHGYTIGGETNMNLRWAGRSLVEAISQDGNYKFEYTYDDLGARTKKTIYEKHSFTIETTNSDGNPTTERKSEFIKSCVVEYVWSNGVIVAQKVSTYSPVKDDNGYYKMNGTEVDISENGNSIIVKPLYNDFNEPLGVNCYITTENDQIESETFYFIKDAQGNIRSIYSMECDYTINMNYDAFGNYSLDLSGNAIEEMQNSIINANGELGQTIARILAEVAMTSMVCIAFTAAPYSYRGYIYDIETGLYYCQSRYYSPSWGRFINADETTLLEMTIGNIHGANLFSYCNNDPVNYTDASGFFATKWIIAFVDVAIIVIPTIFSVNQMLLKGKVAASVFSKISDDLAKLIADFLVEHVKSKVAINIGLTVAKSMGKLVNYFSKISVGFLVEYIIDCLDGSRNHDLNTKTNLKFRIIL